MSCSSCGCHRCCCKKRPPVTSNNGKFGIGTGSPLPLPIVYTVLSGGAIPIEFASGNGEGFVFAPGSTEIGLAANKQYLIVFSITGVPVLADGGLSVAPVLNGGPTAGLAFQGAYPGNSGQVSATGTTIINTITGRNIFQLVNNNSDTVGYSLLRMTITELG